MIYFLLKAGSYRAWWYIRQGNLQGAPSSASLCVVCAPRTPTRAPRVCSSTRPPAVSSPCATWWDMAGCGVGSRQGHPRLLLPSPGCPGHPIHV